MSGNWDPATMYKVSNFVNYTDSEKVKMFTYMVNDLQMALEKQTKYLAEVSTLKETLKEKEEFIKSNANYKFEYESQVKINKDLVKEANEAKADYNKLNQIVRGWCKSSQTTEKLVSIQIPAQVQAILGNETVGPR